MVLLFILVSFIMYVLSVGVLILSYENIGILDFKFKDMDKDDKIFLILSFVPGVNTFMAIIVFSIDFERFKLIFKEMFKDE